jgi:hypothetical protein
VNNQSHTKSSRSKLVPNLPAAWSSKVSNKLVMLEKRKKLLKRLEVSTNLTELKVLLRELILIVTE